MPTPTFGHLNAPRGAVQSQNWVWDSGLLDWVPETQPGGSSGGSGVIVDGVDATIKATVKDYTNSNPLAVVTVDVNGDPVTAGGGTQYAEDTPSTAGELVTMAGVVRKDVRASLVGTDGDRTELQVDANGDLRVRVASDGSPISVFPSTTFPVAIAGDTVTGTVSGIGIASDLQVDEGAGVGALYVTNTGAFIGTLRMVGEVNGTHQLMNQLYNVTDSTVDTTVQFNKIYMFPIGGLRTCALYATAYTSGSCDYELGGGVGSINIPIGTQPVSAASLPLPAGAATSAKQDTLLTELQLKADLTETQPVSLASVPSHAVTLASTTITGSVAVTGPLTDTQLRATPVPVSGTVTANAGTNLNTSALALEATQLLIKAKTDNLDVALSTRLKPADTLAAVTAITNVVHVDDNAGSLTVDNPALSVVGGGVEAAAQRVTIASDSTGVVGTNVTKISGTAASVNSGVRDAGTLRVVIATDQPALTNKLLVTPDSVALPANQSVNLNQAAGTALDVNSGVKSAGTIRVILATDQPQLTNKLLVTPDSVALPANQSVNNAQINGVTPLMGNGITGTGSQRVTIASDNTAFAVNATLTAETTKVIGTVNVAAAQTIAVTQATAASLNATVTPIALTKGTQSATGFSTQDLKDAGRNMTHYFMAAPIITTTAEVMQSLTGYKSGAAVGATVTPAVVTAGKTYRIQSVELHYTAATVIGGALVRLRALSSGVALIGSPLVKTWQVGVPAVFTAGAMMTYIFEYPDGLEFAAGFGVAIGVQGVGADGTTGTITGKIMVVINGYEY